MTIHIMNPEDGSAKCGCNVYWSHYENHVKLEKPIRLISRRCLPYFENKENGLVANCRKCTGTVQQRYQNAPIEKDMVGTKFHRSYGYDMTINEYCEAIRQDAKSLLVQESCAAISGDPWGPGSTGKASAGGINPEGKTFRMFRKTAISGGYEYWAGDGHSWSIDDGGEHYENHCD